MPEGKQTRNTLKLLPLAEYPGNPKFDPISLYRKPVFGKLYRRRVELCLDACHGGERVLEVGFGCGGTFLNLRDMYQEIHGLDLTADVSRVQELFAAKGITTFLRNGNVCELPYPDGHFDTVLLISILEHLKPADLARAFAEMRRVLKPKGQVVYGTPVERPLMVALFWCLGCNIREHHFSTEKDIAAAAMATFGEGRVEQMHTWLGPVYEIGCFGAGEGRTR
ncbi:MAG: class I SAM-dependent methyltransferase [Lentisphaerae bacterium]|nr:class I SAM-dependent methyltransferase [Lentisphaerota bacterium]